jgi:Spy/CpxP family protein refolding chaperone
MQNKRSPQGEKWLGALMIAVAVIIALIGATTTFGRFHGSMHGGVWDQRGHRGYAGHMMGTSGGHAMRRGSMPSQWMGNGFMGPAGMMPGSHTPVWFDYGSELDLSDRQSERIEAIRKQARDVQGELSERVYDQQLQLAKLLRADSPDAAQVGKQYASVTELSRQILEHSVAERSAIDAVLTQEQRDKLRNRRHAWMMNWGEF